MKIYLIGFMGSGKTFWAKKMSEKLSLGYFDIDEEIEQSSELKIINIFSHYGEKHFRNLESKLLLNSSFDGIIATGGGIIEFSENREFLKNNITIWINPDWETLYNRIKKSDRPFVKQLSEHKLHLLWEKRKPLYEECASYVISDDIENGLERILFDLDI